MQSLMCDKIQKCMDEHFSMADQLLQTLKENDFDVQIQDDLLASSDDINNADLVIPIGGDRPYLDAASKLHDSKNTSILGINSVSEYE